MLANKIRRRRKDRKRVVLDSLEIDTSHESESSLSVNELQRPHVVSFCIPSTLKISDKTTPDIIIENENKKNEKCDSDEVILANNNHGHTTNKSNPSSKMPIGKKMSSSISKLNAEPNQSGTSIQNYEALACSPLKMKKMDVCSTPVMKNGAALDWSIGPIASSDEDQNGEKIYHTRGNEKLMDKVIDCMKNKLNPKNAGRSNLLEINKKKAVTKSRGLVKSLFQHKLSNKGKTQHTNLDKGENGCHAVEDWNSHNEMTMKYKKDKSRKITEDAKIDYDKFDIIPHTENEKNKGNINMELNNAAPRMRQESVQAHLDKGMTQQPEGLPINNAMSINLGGPFATEIQRMNKEAPLPEPTNGTLQKLQKVTCTSQIIPIKSLRGREITAGLHPSKTKKRKFEVPTSIAVPNKKSPKVNVQQSINTAPKLDVAIAELNKANHSSPNQNTNTETEGIPVQNDFTKLISETIANKQNNLVEEMNNFTVVSIPREKNESLTQNKQAQQQEKSAKSKRYDDAVPFVPCSNPDNIPQLAKVNVVSVESVQMDVAKLLKDAAANRLNGDFNTHLSQKEAIDSSRSSQEMNRSHRLQILNELEQLNQPGPSRPRKTIKIINRSTVEHQAKYLESVKKISKQKKGKINYKNEAESYFLNASQKKKKSKLNKTFRRPLYSGNTDIDFYTSPPSQSTVKTSEKISGNNTVRQSNLVKQHVRHPDNNIQAEGDSMVNDQDNINKIYSTRATSRKSENTLQNTSIAHQSARSRFQVRPFWINACRLHYNSNGTAYDAQGKSNKEVIAQESVRKSTTVSNVKTRQSAFKKRGRRKKTVQAVSNKACDKQSIFNESVATVILNIEQPHNEVPGSGLPLIVEEEVFSTGNVNKTEPAQAKVPKRRGRKKKILENEENKDNKEDHCKVPRRRGRRKETVENEKYCQSNESVATLILNKEQQRDIGAPDLPLIEEDKMLITGIVNKPETAPTKVPKRRGRKKKTVENEGKPPSGLPLLEEEITNAVNTDELPIETPNPPSADVILNVDEVQNVLAAAISVIHENEQDNDANHQVADAQEVVHALEVADANQGGADVTRVAGTAGTEALDSATMTSGVRQTIDIPSIGLTECFSRPVSDDDFRTITAKLSKAVCLESSDMQASYLKVKAFGEKKLGSSHKNDFIFYVLKGTVSIMIHSARSDSIKGEFFYVPCGTRYHIQNRTRQDVLLLCVSIRKEQPNSA